MWDTKSSSAGLPLLQLELIECSHYFGPAQKTNQERTGDPKAIFHRAQRQESCDSESGNVTEKKKSRQI